MSADSLRSTSSFSRVKRERFSSCSMNWHQLQEKQSWTAAIFAPLMSAWCSHLALNGSWHAPFPVPCSLRCFFTIHSHVRIPCPTPVSGLSNLIISLLFSKYFTSSSFTDSTSKSQLSNTNSMTYLIVKTFLPCYLTSVFSPIISPCLGKRCFFFLTWFPTAFVQDSSKVLGGKDSTVIFIFCSIRVFFSPFIYL